MITNFNCIISLHGGKFFFLQSGFNQTDPETLEPISSEDNYYVGYPCTGSGEDEATYITDKSPFSGHQPGQVYPTQNVPSKDDAATTISSYFQ